MAGSQDYLNQMQAMGQMPNYQQELAKAYEAPVLRPLVQEGASLEAQYLPSLFQPFTQMGTEASDMSPAAKLASIGSSVGRLGSRIGSNNAIQNYFGGQIGDLAGNMSNQWNQQYGRLKDMYQMAYQKEQDNRAAAQAAAAQKRAMDAQRAQDELLRQIYQQKQTGGTSLPGFTPQQQAAAQNLYNVGSSVVNPLANAFSQTGLNNPMINTLVTGLVGNSPIGPLANAFLRR